MLIILEKRVKYKLLKLLKVTIVATINNNEKTNNNSITVYLTKYLLSYLFLLSVRKQKKSKR